MEDTLSIIFAIMISLILMFLFPLVDAWDLQDNLSYAIAYSATVDFVDTARNTGYISRDLYDSFQGKLLATGNTFEVTLEHREFNEDLKAYLNKYTNEIEKVLDSGNNYKLDKYDYFYVTVKNSNRTQATIINDFFSSSHGTNTKIAVAYGGVVWSVRDEF